MKGIYVGILTANTMFFFYRSGKADIDNDEVTFFLFGLMQLGAILAATV
jgi:hypothetical protein